MANDQLELREVQLQGIREDGSAMSASADFTFAPAEQIKAPVMIVRGAVWTHRPDAGHAIAMPQMAGVPVATIDKNFLPVVQRRLDDIRIEARGRTNHVWQAAVLAPDDDAYVNVSHVRITHVRQKSTPTVRAMMDVKLCRSLTIHGVWLALHEGTYSVLFPQNHAEPLSDAMMLAVKNAAGTAYKSVATNDPQHDWTVAFRDGIPSNVIKQYRT